jgi:4-nitrophenyl phosphatase
VSGVSAAAPGNIVCDLDGVVYLGESPIRGAGGALHALEAAGYRLLFATNNSSRTVGEVVAKISRTSGYTPEPDQIIGSAEAAAALLVPSRPRVWVLGGAGITEALGRYDIEITPNPLDAGAVVMGLRMDMTYGDLTDATRAVRNGARFVATNSDPTFPTPEGLVPGAGALVAAVEMASGVRAEVAGKPHEPIRRLISERLGPGSVWVVGDRAETDLALAHAAGWTPVLVLGGVTARAEDVPEEMAPELVVDSLADLATIVVG